MSELRIEEGKFYRSRDGRKVGPMYFIGPNHFDGAEDGPYPQKCFYGDGQRFDGDDRGLCLVAEWTDQPCSPVRTVTRKEVVPGTYGKVRVLAKATNDPFPSHAHVRIDDGQSSADELRAAAAILIEIADALDSPSLTEAGRTG
jgi:hypothetical protein